MLPRETRTLTVTIPDRITRFGAAGALERIDLDDVAQVRVVLAYSETPFHPKPGEGHAEQSERLRSAFREREQVLRVSEQPR